MRAFYRNKDTRPEKKNSPFFSPMVQPKLEVSNPGDEYEKEADKMADKVVSRSSSETNNFFQANNTPNTNLSAKKAIQEKPLAQSITPLVQKKEETPPTKKDEKELVQQKEEEDKLKKPIEGVQRKEEDEVQTKKEDEKEIVQQKKEDEDEKKKTIKGVQKKEKEDDKEIVQKKEEEDKKERSTEGVQKKKEDKIQTQKEEEKEKVQKKEDEEPKKEKEKDKVQSKLEDEKKEKKEIQKKAENKSSTSPKVESALTHNKGNGSPMPQNVKTEMESGFGADFSHVNIHTDSEAARMSNELGAQAFTNGNDVYFNKGKYNPTSQEGKFLLAHELTHTIQQQGAKNAINKYPEVECSDGQTIDRAKTVVWFEQDSTNLRTDSNINFLQLVLEIKNYLNLAGPKGVVLIHGYASEDGDASYNLNLSLQRALRIKSLLVINGIPEAQMIPFAHGENTEYKNLENNRRVEVSYYPAVTCMEFAPETIFGSITEIEYSDGRDINNNADHDLDKFTHKPEDRSPDIKIYDNLLGESLAYSDFYIGFYTGTFGVDTSDDDRLFDHFEYGSGSQIDFKTGSDMAREIGSTDAFTTFAVEFEKSVREYYNTHHTLKGFDCQAELIRTRPNYIGGTDSLFSWAVMGGYQRLEARIDLSDGDINITYRIFDHYGAGVSDAWSYLPGLSAMYYLQHYVRSSSSTYKPFIWSVRVNRINDL
jgi:outer membrane protein OmpA-like peptidoglycan-associated protein